jgi:hypothetical protein
MNSSANPQWELELQRKRGKRDGINDADEDAAVDDDALTSNDLCSIKDDASSQVLPLDPFRR